MLEFVASAIEARANINSYLRECREPGVFNPRLVRHWYLDPGTGHVGPARYVAYRGMTAAAYDEHKRRDKSVQFDATEHIHGGPGQQYLRDQAWVRSLHPKEPEFRTAYDAALMIVSYSRYLDKCRFWVVKG